MDTVIKNWNQRITVRLNSCKRIFHSHAIDVILRYYGYIYSDFLKDGLALKNETPNVGTKIKQKLWYVGTTRNKDGYQTDIGWSAQYQDFVEYHFPLWKITLNKKWQFKTLKTGLISERIVSWNWVWKVWFSIVRTHVAKRTTHNSDSTSTKALDKMTCYHTLVLILLFAYERPKRDLLLSCQVSCISLRQTTRMYSNYSYVQRPDTWYQQTMNKDRKIVAVLNTAWPQAILESIRLYIIQMLSVF